MMLYQCWKCLLIPRRRKQFISGDVLGRTIENEMIILCTWCKVLPTSIFISITGWYGRRSSCLFA
jgi:hypothetical protein